MARPIQIHTNVLLRYLEANLESYHIDEEDLQNDVLRVAKKSVKDGIIQQLGDDLEYDCDIKGNKHKGDICLIGETENEEFHIYVIETKIINKPDYPPLYKKPDIYENRRKKVKEQTIKYSEYMYNLAKSVSEKFWDDPKNKLYGIMLTDEGVYVETVVNVPYYTNIENGVKIFE